jgi:hypothetical protein
MAVVSRNEQIDEQAAADASRGSLMSEIRLLHDGRSWAGDDPYAQSLVLSKVEQLSIRNDRRIARRFG